MGLFKDVNCLSPDGEMSIEEENFRSARTDCESRERSTFLYLFYVELGKN